MPATTLCPKEFVKGYIECALWSSTGEDEEPLDRDYGPEDLTAEAWHRAMDDCIDFIAANSHLLLKTDASAEQHGHDFWLTRNGHGAGFWDRGYGDVGTELTEACRPYGGCWPCVGNDGTIDFV